MSEFRYLVVNVAGNWQAERLHSNHSAAKYAYFKANANLLQTAFCSFVSAQQVSCKHKIRNILALISLIFPEIIPG